jgi:asparagine synthase (glutamine-hydrolysing)
MCGLVGVMSATGVDEVRLARMRDALGHRGPDDASSWISDDRRVGLAHRRLAIIDLSMAGRQPMANDDGSVTLVFNGEIYNYLELKKRLESLGHRFRTSSDTETIIRAYEEWGLACFNELRGMFALALWDARRQELVLARDHTGIKPLFYYWDGNTFAMASEMKAFWALGGLDRSVDRSAIFDYLTYLYVPAPKTAYTRVRKLLPGHHLVFDGRQITERQYWDVALEQDAGMDESQAIQLVRERLADAVAMNLVSDVPVGAFLSGGLDSSSVVAHMARPKADPALTFSIGFDVPGHSETDYARIVARAFHTSHHERIVGAASIRDMLPRVVDLYDEPFADGSAIPTVRVSELAREHVKVVLSGDGGDEVFAGYRWYGRWMLMQEVNRRIPLPLRRNMVSAGHLWPKGARGATIKRMLETMAVDPLSQYASLMELFSPMEKRNLLGPDWAAEFADYDDHWSFRKYYRPDIDPITRVQYLDLKTYLPDDILTKVDRATMSVGLEARPALLDHRLIEALFRIPARLRFKWTKPKHLLTRAMENTLPRVILHRAKKGFSSPLMKWMADERPWAQRFLKESARLVRLESLGEMGRHQRGARWWAMLVLETWAARQPAM